MLMLHLFRQTFDWPQIFAFFNHRFSYYFRSITSRSQILLLVRGICLEAQGLPISSVSTAVETQHIHTSNAATSTHVRTIFIHSEHVSMCVCVLCMSFIYISSE